MKLLGVVGALRRASWNRRLLRIAARLAAEHGAQIEIAELRDLEMPFYDGDLEAEQGLPANALELSRRVAACDGLLIASPEYNHSMSAVLKNALDWLSRVNTYPLAGKYALLMSASTSHVGGALGLAHLRDSLSGCDVFVHHTPFCLAHANRAFDDEGDLNDVARKEQLRALIKGFLTQMCCFGR